MHTHEFLFLGLFGTFVWGIVQMLVIYHNMERSKVMEGGFSGEKFEMIMDVVVPSLVASVSFVGGAGMILLL